MGRVAIEDQPNQTLAKGLTILESFTAENPDWGIRQLARALDTNPATVYRIVATLNNAGYLEQDPETQRYHLGPRVMRLAAYYSHQNRLPKIGHKVFESFSDSFEYNFYLGALSRRFEVVYLSVFDGRSPLKIEVELGGSISLHSTAIGKILLSYQDDEYITDFLRSQPLTRYTPRTITEPQCLRDEITCIRNNGYAVNDGERFDEVAAIGVPVIGRDHIVKNSVSLAYPRHLSGISGLHVDRLVNLAREVASEIASRHEGFPSAV